MATIYKELIKLEFKILITILASYNNLGQPAFIHVQAVPICLQRFL
jgi:hypothetical protein